MGEHTCIANLFLNNFIKMYIFFEASASRMKILDGW
jgi:hypothetical protein